MEVEDCGNPIKRLKGCSIHFPDFPSNNKELLDRIMETDDVNHLLTKLESVPIIEVNDEMIEHYKEENFRALMEFLCHPEWD